MADEKRTPKNPLFQDLTERRFGALLVLEYAGNDRHGGALWKCRCGCGRTTVVRSKNLRRGITRTCGCRKGMPFEQWFWSQVNKGDGCWTWTGGTFIRGYGMVAIRRRLHYSHRVSYELAFGPIPAGMCVCHRCDNPACVNPDHLFLGTDADNMRDRDGKGRNARGERIGNAKLDDERVREIRQRYAAGDAPKDLAEEHGIGKSAIFAIVKRKTWKHVE